MINKCFINLSPQTFTNLYKCILRPCLEYGISYGVLIIKWRWHWKGPKIYNQDDTINQTSILWGTLKISQPTNSKYHRLCGDMIMTYNIINGHLNVNEAYFFTRAWMATRGHFCRLFKQFTLREVRQKHFSHCIVNNWNSLSSSFVEAESTNEFKKLFDNLNNDIMFNIDL